MWLSLTSTSISSDDMSTMMQTPVRVKPPPALTGETISPAGRPSLGAETTSGPRGRWSGNYEQRAATTALAVIGGGLVFAGDVNGRFRAFDDRNGEILWEFTSAPRFPASRSPARWTATIARLSGGQSPGKADGDPNAPLTDDVGAGHQLSRAPAA